MEKISFGISITGKEELAFLQKPSFFSAADISGELLDSSEEILSGVGKKMTLCASEVIPRKILEAIPETPAPVREEIFSLFDRRCEIMKRCGISRAFLAPDLLRLLQEPPFFAAESSFLRGCFGIAYQRNIRLAMELRIPGALAEQAEKFLRLKEKFLYPTGTLLDLHPHEPEALHALETALKKLPFDSGCWRLSFDANSGNYPGVELMRRILPKISASCGETPLLFFSPGAGGNREVFTSVQELCREAAGTEKTGETR